MTTRLNRTPQRLLCIYQHAPTPGAPGIYRHRRYFAELVRRGWCVDIVSTPRNYMSGELPDHYRRRLFTLELIDGIHHHWVWTPGGIHRSRMRRVTNYVGFALAAAVRAFTLPRPDVVLVSSPPLTVAPLGPILGRRFRCPWVLEVRDIWPESAVSVGWLRRESVAYRTLDAVARRVTAAASIVIVPTPGLVALVREHGAKDIVTLPGAVVAQPSDDDRRRRVRGQLGVNENDCVFLYLGALGVANGVDLLLDAVQHLRTEIPARFIIAGDGSDRQRLEERLAARPDRRVSLLPPVPRDEADDLLLAADVGLHLLRPDPVFESALPTKALEYLSASLPFLTTTRGLPAEVAVAGGGAAVTTSAELTAELSRWVELTPQERRARGAQALAYGLECFGLEAGVARLEGLLADAIARR